MNPTTQQKEEKAFSELNENQKIETLRTAVLSMQKEMSYFRNQVSSLQSEVFKLKNHYHAEGRVVIAIENSNATGSAGLVSGSLAQMRNPLH